MSKSQSARVCVIVVNWNGWMDTVLCLESLLRVEHGLSRIIVCDNGSHDESIQRLIDWARGSLPPPTPAHESLRRLVFPPVKKPVSISVRNVGQGIYDDDTSDPMVVVLRIGRNLGFAGANNVGMQYALEQYPCDYVWLLNNDTLVSPDSLASMLERAARESRVGICGSTLARMDAPERIQARGGASFNQWLGVQHHVGEGELVKTEVDPAIVERDFDYIVGASMLVSRDFVQTIGPLNEDYFLYFEELDWALRARPSFRQVYAPASVIYHKEGASTGGNLLDRRRPVTTDYYWLRNRLLVTLRHYPYALPTVALACLASLVRRAVRAGPLHALRVLIMLVRYGWRRPLRPVSHEGPVAAHPR